MSIQFQCPNCVTDLLADESEGGSNIECLHCGSVIRVPSLNGEAESSVSTANRIRPDSIPVSTTEVPTEFRVISPINFVIGSRGGMKNEFEHHKATLGHVITKAGKLGQISKTASLAQTITKIGINGDGHLTLGAQNSGASFVSSDLEIAFMIAVYQMQLRASYLGANAVYGFRWDIDVDSNSNVLNFLGTAYGTAVIV